MLNDWSDREPDPPPPLGFKVALYAFVAALGTAIAWGLYYAVAWWVARLG